MLNHVALYYRRLCRRLAPRAQYKRRRGPARALRRLRRRVLPCAGAFRRVAPRAAFKRGMRQRLNRGVGARDSHGLESPQVLKELTRNRDAESGYEHDLHGPRATVSLAYRAG